MSVQFPQTDYPRGSLPRGGGDIWDTPQASVVLADDMFAAAAPSGITLTGNNVASTTTSTQGAVGQTHVLGGNACRQDTTATQAAIVQTHVVSGSSARQDTTSSSAAVTQTQTVAGNSVAQTPTSSVGTVSQNHVLTGASAAQPVTSTSGDVTVPAGSIVLTGNSCRSDHTSASGACIQEHLLAGSSVKADSSCTAGGVGQDHMLSGTGALAQSTSSSAGVSQSHILVGAGVAVDHIAAASAIVQTHILSGANCASFIEDGLALGIVTHPSVQFMQNTYDAQCLEREYGIGMTSNSFDANLQSLALGTVFQEDQRTMTMEN
jgi:hypothetical protein